MGRAQTHLHSLIIIRTPLWSNSHVTMEKRCSEFARVRACLHSCYVNQGRECGRRIHVSPILSEPVAVPLLYVLSLQPSLAFRAASLRSLASSKLPITFSCFSCNSIIRSNA